VATIIAAASLALSATMAWLSLNNRTDDRLNDLSVKTAQATALAQNNANRLDHDEAWIGWIVQQKMGRQ
jgi:hypothetical protein